MPKPFFTRLKAYYEAVGKVLKGEADAASIFPNAGDIGQSRERIYAEILRQHCPSKCNIISGGFLFDEDGAESKQIDLIVTTDVNPQFNLLGGDEGGKNFACVEGTLACISVKSMLNGDELTDSLINLASIPATRPLVGRIAANVILGNYPDWPYKVIYASSGLSAETISEHLNEFFIAHPEIPEERRPNIIHVAGKYIIIRSAGGELLDGVPQERGSFAVVLDKPDVHGIIWTVDAIQKRATASAYIIFDYSFILNRVHL